MPIAKIHVLEGRYDERRLSNVSQAVHEALISVLKIPPDECFQIIHELPRNRFLHAPSFLGMEYSDDVILLELAFIFGRPLPTRRSPPRWGLVPPVAADLAPRSPSTYTRRTCRGSTPRTSCAEPTRSALIRTLRVATSTSRSASTAHS